MHYYVLFLQTGALALLSPRTVPWLGAETLASHGTDYLAVVFSLQKPGKKQNIKPHNPLRYESSGPDSVSKLRKRIPTHSTKGSRKSRKQPPWWDSGTEKAWTIKGSATGNWQKGRTRPNPDPKLKAAMDTIIWTVQADSTGGKRREIKASVKNSVLKNADNSTPKMEGSDRTKTTPDSEDANRSSLRTNEEKSQALFGRFMQQSNQNN